MLENSFPWNSYPNKSSSFDAGRKRIKIRDLEIYDFWTDLGKKKGVWESTDVNPCPLLRKPRREIFLKHTKCMQFLKI